MQSSASHATDSSIPSLRAAVSGRVITPEDAACDQARTVYYDGIDRRPRVIVRAADATEVSYVASAAGDGIGVGSAAIEGSLR